MARTKRVGIVNNIPQTLENKGFGGFLFVREYFLSTFGLFLQVIIFQQTEVILIHIVQFVLL